MSIFILSGNPLLYHLSCLSVLAILLILILISFWFLLIIVVNALKKMFIDYYYWYIHYQERHRDYSNGNERTPTCFGHGTYLLLSNGTFRAVEDLQLGDRLKAADNSVSIITRLTRGNNCLYAIDMGYSGRDTWYCTSSHRLVIRYKTSPPEPVRQDSHGNWYYIRATQLVAYADCDQLGRPKSDDYPTREAAAQVREEELRIFREGPGFIECTITPDMHITSTTMRNMARMYQPIIEYNFMPMNEGDPTFEAHVGQVCHVLHYYDCIVFIIQTINMM